ncbi:MULTISPECIES: 5-methylcytosine restriction system specificity protein McrC [unclassified Streptomyces]|uniref:5-methylcytosine restriction system specificity protein McrC n=1 Tax=unclassified Streptomyces TaxID=2593676 RepID=UPI0013681C29|nr:PE-PGRS family protein [Streptomyces sp. SID6139]MYR04111.1 PE-PGRS family protein [Streptomyces sp. SID6139]MYR19196.1 PE-PGRS family protein [Streptomyces sp. SID6137]
MRSSGEHRSGLREIRLEEHRSVLLKHDELTEADRRTLQPLLASNRLRLLDTRAGWQLKTKSTVGVLRLERVRLVIEPKIAISGSRLISWLCYAQDTPVRHEATDRQWLTGSSGYTDVVPAALLAECRALLAEGLHRDYVRLERTEPVLRGQLDLRAQLTRRYGAVDRLHVRTFERDADVWENLICGAALHAAIPLTTDRDLIRALRGTAALFPQPRPGVTASRLLARARYTRHNSRYRAAHSWAGLVLGGGGLTDLLRDRGLSTGSLLLGMDLLWERVVQRMAAHAAAGYGGRRVDLGSGRAITTHDEAGPYPRPFRPDVLLRFPGREPGEPARFLPVDAKYIGYEGRRLSADNRHQLLTYIAGYTTPEAPLAAIVHPAAQSFSSRTVQLKGPRGRLGVIKVLGIDTRLAPEQAAQPLRDLVEEFAAGGG